MNNKRLFAAVGLTVLLGLTVFPMIQGMSTASEVRIIRLYADTIITTERMVEENPDLVERFLRATLNGWRYAIENSAEAVDITLQFDATLTRDRQMRMMEVQKYFAVYVKCLSVSQIVFYNILIFTKRALNY